MSLILIARINELVKEPQCVYQALESILPHCHSPANTAERQRLAAQLTVCDYTAAGLALPPACINNREPSECIAELEGRSQWWTSYTANYQTVGQVCVEFQPEFEAQMAAQMYRNFSQITQSYLSGLQNAYGDLSQVYDRIEAQSTILKTMESVLAEVRMQTALVQEQLVQVQGSGGLVQTSLEASERQSMHLLSLQSDMVQKITETILDLDLVQNTVDARFANVVMQLDSIANAAAAVQVVQNATMANALNASAITARTVQTLKTQTGALIDIVAQVRTFLQLFLRFWGWFVTIVVIIILKQVFWTTPHINGREDRGGSRHLGPRQLSGGGSSSLQL